MVLSNLKLALQNNGVKKIDVKEGDLFNSLEHYAIEERESSKSKPGEIISVNLSGYKLYERLLRPATVVVAKEKTKQTKEIQEKGVFRKKEH